MLLTYLRQLVLRLIAPLVHFATKGAICRWEVCEEDGVMMLVVTDPFDQRYSMPQSAADFRDIALSINQMVDESENDPQIRSL